MPNGRRLALLPGSVWVQRTWFSLFALMVMLLKPSRTLASRPGRVFMLDRRSQVSGTAPEPQQPPLHASRNSSSGKEAPHAVIGESSIPSEGREERPAASQMYNVKDQAHVKESPRDVFVDRRRILAGDQAASSSGELHGKTAAAQPTKGLVQTTTVPIAATTTGLAAYPTTADAAQSGATEAPVAPPPAGTTAATTSNESQDYYYDYYDGQQPVAPTPAGTTAATTSNEPSQTSTTMFPPTTSPKEAPQMAPAEAVTTTMFPPTTASLQTPSPALASATTTMFPAVTTTTVAATPITVTNTTMFPPTTMTTAVPQAAVGTTTMFPPTTAATEAPNLAVSSSTMFAPTTQPATEEQTVQPSTSMFPRTTTSPQAPRPAVGKTTMFPPTTATAVKTTSKHADTTMFPATTTLPQAPAPLLRNTTMFPPSTQAAAQTTTTLPDTTMFPRTTTTVRDAKAETFSSNTTMFPPSTTSGNPRNSSTFRATTSLFPATTTLERNPGNVVPNTTLSDTTVFPPTTTSQKARNTTSEPTTTFQLGPTTTIALGPDGLPLTTTTTTSSWTAVFNVTTAFVGGPNATLPPCDDTGIAAAAASEFAKVCGDEADSGICRCDGTVYFGRKYVEGTRRERTLRETAQDPLKVKTVAGSIGCNAKDFEADPAPHVEKHCFCDTQCFCTGGVLYGEACVEDAEFGWWCYVMPGCPSAVAGWLGNWSTSPCRDFTAADKKATAHEQDVVQAETQSEQEAQGDYEAAADWEDELEEANVDDRLGTPENMTYTQDPCECIVSWDYHAGIYQGCGAQTEDRPNSTWCFVKGGSQCASALDDPEMEAGEERKWKYCDVADAQTKALLKELQAAVEPLLPRRTRVQFTNLLVVPVNMTWAHSDGSVRTSYYISGDPSWSLHLQPTQSVTVLARCGQLWSARDHVHGFELERFFVPTDPAELTGTTSFDVGRATPLHRAKSTARTSRSLSLREDDEADADMEQ
eukprot:TRINITY_DN2099_c0_g1_i1.p1 TRINITY_DN2099_c0_g1~~TRINITY_DN2099_c0_g1_i1.p1  ORF type:complete len:981 (+),score=118.96 TRINITY_DN2099_c0_g1_i1:197-3139(+)